MGTLEDGSRVYFGASRTPFGSMAERTVIRQSMFVPLPDGIDDVQAAAIANPGMSAWVSLKERAQERGNGSDAGSNGCRWANGDSGGAATGRKARDRGGAQCGSPCGGGCGRVIALGQPEDAVRDAFAAEAANGIDVVIDYLWGRPTELLLEGAGEGFGPAPPIGRGWWKWARARAEH